jgi:predicted XRE-type DNA-binding protein
MNNLNQLVITYKQTKDNNLLNKILKTLMPLIIKKSTYLFYRKKYNQHDKIFYLYELGTITLEDIKQELSMFTIKTINKYEYKPKFNFISYYLYCIWHWGKNLIKLCDEYKKVSYNKENEQDYSSENSEPFSLPDIDIYNLERLKTTKQELIIMEMIKDNPKIKQSQMAERLGVTQSRVSQIVKKLRKKIRKYIQT